MSRNERMSYEQFTYTLAHAADTKVYFDQSRMAEDEKNEIQPLARRLQTATLKMPDDVRFMYKMYQKDALLFRNTELRKAYPQEGDDYVLSMDYSHMADVKELTAIKTAVDSYFDMMIYLLKSRKIKYRHYISDSSVKLLWSCKDRDVYTKDKVQFTFMTEFYDHLPNRQDLLSITVTNLRFQGQMIF